MVSGFRKFMLWPLCAAIAVAATVAHAQSYDPPRRLSASLATSPQSKITEPAILPQLGSEMPPTILVQSVEPLPSDNVSAHPIATEIIETPTPPQQIEILPEGHPSPMTDPQIYYEGTPDTFPGFAGPNESVAPGAGLPCENCGDCADCQSCLSCFTWQILPSDLIYHSYLAGPKEPRFAAIFWHDKDLGWQLDYTVGGRVGLFRYGNTDPIWPQGWQLDIEGAAFPRDNLDQNMDLDAADFRVGLPLTYGKDKWQAKLEVYHLSAHVGDEFLIRNPSFERINYVRDALVAGFSYYPVNMVRLYGEVEWGFHLDGGAKPWAFQFGFEVSPLRNNGCGGDPFLALNTSLREDVDFGGSLCLQAGWQWRGNNNRRLLRTGFHYLTGKSNQFEFYRQSENQVGVGLWYDF